NAGEDTSAELLPAVSVQWPVTVSPVPSGLEYVPLKHDAIPLVASVPVVLHATEWLYHPLLSADRPRAVVAVGFTVSILAGAPLMLAATLPAESVTVPEAIDTAEPFVVVDCVKEA